MTKRIAIVGAGVAGIVAAYLLDKKYSVVVFEKNKRLGGHTNTVILNDGPDQGQAIDTGFIVCNDQTYPLFHCFLKDLKVSVRDSDMSFAYQCDHTGFCYAGSNLFGLFAQPKNIFNRNFLFMLAEIRKFSKNAIASLENGSLKNSTLGDFLERESFSQFFAQCYLIPMSAAIWSTPDKDIYKLPAELFVRFFKNHGLLSLKDRPIWQTVTGGSSSYIKAFTRLFSGELRMNARIQNISRQGDGVDIELEDAPTEKFDAVFLACHADQVLPLLADPSAEEKELFLAWRYSSNKTVLHDDHSLLPSNLRARASWNYRRYQDSNTDLPIEVSYHMNRLQGLSLEKDYLVTLNPRQRIATENIIEQFNYQHPVFDRSSSATQNGISRLNGERNTYYCGSYLGYGFHEDAVRSAFLAARKLSSELDFQCR